jgi:hypothetical protein
MPPPWLTPSPAYAVGTLYQDIQVGHNYFGPDGLEIKVTGLQVSPCGERRLSYILAAQPAWVKTPTCFSVPFGLLGYNFYLSKPSAEQIAANKAEMMPNHNSESSDDYP